jgi:hypothetical protein
MKTDIAIRQEGMIALINTLGYVDAERFVALVNRETFDYTQWRKTNLQENNLSVRELSKLAMEYVQNNSL